MKIRLLNTQKHLEEKLKNPEFKKLYELERAKVSLAQRIAETREEHHLTQKELAQRMKVSQQYISQIESGDATTNLTMETMYKLAQCLDSCFEITFKKRNSKKACLLVA